ncbi:MAG: ATP-binding cassette domain-containing protein, partial [Planctomycetota bacterium]
VLVPSLAAPAADARARALELIERFGMSPRARHVPGELSTGERQRAALARALLNRPKVLLADEPTGNLDEANSETVLDCLARFADAGGAVLLVTHDQQAAGRAGRILRLDGGRLEATADERR